MALNILVVDDSTAIRKILIRVLRQTALAIGEIFEARDEKFFNRLRFAVAAIEQTLREQRGDFKLRRQLSGEQRLRRRERPVEFHFFNRRLRGCARIGKVEFQTFADVEFWSATADAPMFGRSPLCHHSTSALAT